MTPFNSPDATFAAQADRIFRLYDLVGEIRDSMGRPTPDARHVCLNNIMMAANAAVATLRLFHWAKEGGESVLTKALGLAKPEYINPVAEDLLRSSRLHLLVEYQFQIEALFGAIARAIGVHATTKGFYNVATALASQLPLTDPASMVQLLNVPALMRNSMHTNGIHHGYKGADTTVAIDGVEFRFEHGKRVQCGSWYHIAVALTASMGVVRGILEAPKISALASIPDEYASQVAAPDGK